MRLYQGDICYTESSSLNLVNKLSIGSCFCRVLIKHQRMNAYFFISTSGEAAIKPPNWGQSLPQAHPSGRRTKSSNLRYQSSGCWSWILSVTRRKWGSCLAVNSHKTLDTAQPCRHLLEPNWKPSSSHSISAPANINTQFLLQSFCVCVCVCVCVCSAFFGCCFCIILYVNCFRRTMLYMCIEYRI